MAPVICWNSINTPPTTRKTYKTQTNKTGYGDIGAFTHTQRQASPVVRLFLNISATQPQGVGWELLGRKAGVDVTALPLGCSGPGGWKGHKQAMVSSQQGGAMGTHALLQPHSSVKFKALTPWRATSKVHPIVSVEIPGRDSV